MAYITLAEVRSFLSGGNKSMPTVDDTLLTTFITNAQSIIENYTKRKFESSTETRYFDLPKRGCRELELYGDLLTVTTLTNGDGTVISSTYYNLEPYNSAPYRSITLKQSYASGWLGTTNGDTERCISVAGTWGYSATPPDAIKQAMLRLTQWLYRQKDTAADVDRPLLTNSGVVVMPSSLPKDVESLLRAFRLSLL